MRKPGKNNKKSILIYGAGQIGTMYKEYFSKVGYKTILPQVDITDRKMVVKSLQKYKPEIVINTAAKTNLEWCSNNKLEAVHINTLAADLVAEECEKRNIYLVHLSSGCIFESINPSDSKKEDDKPSPAAFYSWTKVWAENLISARKSLKYLILRPRQPVSSQVSEKNMLIKMLTFSKFVGEKGGWNSGTVLEDMMWITKELIERKATGAIHVANDGWVTPYEIALLLKKHINPGMKFTKITHLQLDRMMPNKRVATVLDISKLKSMGIDPGLYKIRLEEIIIDLKDNLKSKTSKTILTRTTNTTKQRSETSSHWLKIFK